MRDYRAEINKYIELEIEAVKKLDVDAINEVMNVLEDARNRSANIYICGNGGSAATASHFVCDFNKGVSLEQDKKYNFICLNDNVPNMMAIANDIGYDRVFDIPLQNKIKSTDLLIVISGRGNSRNVINAVEYAKKIGAKIIGVTGYNGGIIMELADYNLHVPIDNMQVTEDIHMMLNHLMMWVISNE